MKHLLSPAPARSAPPPVVVAPGRIDGWLAGAAGALLAFGLLMVIDASFFLGEHRFGDPYALPRRQLVAAFLAVAMAAACARLELRAWRRLSYPALGAVILLLVAIFVPGLGVVRGGARRWLTLGGLVFEPSELLKPVLVVALAHSISRKGARIESFVDGVLPHLLVALLAAALLLAQPDFGGAMMTLLLTGVMLFVGGARFGHLLAPALAAMPVAAALVLSSSNRLQRITCFADPFEQARGCGFQLVQSLLAFGQGGWSGVGLGSGNQKLFYLPEGHTDFVFALVGEEAGLVGALLVLVGFGVLGSRGCRVASRLGDGFGRLVAIGLTFALVAQAAVNIGVVLGLLPTKGVPLPLMSYGGSSLVSTGIVIGLLLGLSREAR